MTPTTCCRQGKEVSGVRQQWILNRLGGREDDLGSLLRNGSAKSTRPTVTHDEVDPWRNRQVAETGPATIRDVVTANAQNDKFGKHMSLWKPNPVWLRSLHGNLRKKTVIPQITHH